MVLTYITNLILYSNQNHIRNIGLFGGNGTSRVGYFIGMHRDLRIRKAVVVTVSSSEFNTISLNSKISKVVSYIQYNKAWERIYVILRILYLVFRFFVLQIVTNQ